MTSETGTGSPPSSRTATAIVLAFYAGLAVLTQAASALLGVQPLHTWQWRPAHAGVGAVAALPLVLLFVLLMRWEWAPLVRVRRFLVEQLRPLLAGRSLGELALIAGLAGLTEEMLFRGLLQEGLAAWLGSAGGLLAAGLLFGASHWITPAYVLVAGLMGLYLGCLYQATGNLLAPVLAHAAYDFAALTLLLRTGVTVRPPSPGPGPR
ncbi:MAG: CPBP family intramembrane glutamic endopeptidase [Candidatus Latescibacterota bacterium]